MTPTTQPLNTQHHDTAGRLPPVISTGCAGAMLSVQFASPPTEQQQLRLHCLLTADWLAQRPLQRAEVHNLVLPHVTGLRGVSAMQALDAVDAISLAVVDRMHASGVQVGTAPADQAIEHDRSGEAPTAALDPALARVDGIDMAEAIPTRRDLLDRPTLGPNFPRASVARAQDAAAAPSADGWPRLQRPVQVGNTSFGAGVSARMVIQRAEREHEYRRRPEIERVRIQQGAEALRALRSAIGLEPKVDTTADELVAAAERLIADARAAGHVVTISLQPREPLAMGHHQAVVDLRPAKG